MKRNKTEHHQAKRKHTGKTKGSKYANKCKKSGNGIGIMNKQHTIKLTNGYNYLVCM